MAPSARGSDRARLFRHSQPILLRACGPGRRRSRRGKGPGHGRPAGRRAVNGYRRGPCPAALLRSWTLALVIGAAGAFGLAACSSSPSTPSSVELEHLAHRATPRSPPRPPRRAVAPLDRHRAPSRPPTAPPPAPPAPRRPSPSPRAPRRPRSRARTSSSAPGRSAAPGDTVTVQYVLATYSSRKVIQSSWTSQPFTFTLGAGQVIPGWDKGVVGMKVGRAARADHPAEPRLQGAVARGRASRRTTRSSSSSTSSRSTERRRSAWRSPPTSRRCATRAS